MNPRVSRRWTAGVFTVAAIALVTASAVADPQRETSAEGRLAFEAAIIKLAAPDAVRNQVMPTSPNHLRIPSMTLTALIYAAYGDGGFNTSMRVTGGPAWINKTAFSVEGVASGPATPQQRRLMLQTLLDERFALKIRRPTQTANMPIYDVLALVVDRRDGTLGPKVKKWDGTCPPVMPALYFQAPRRALQKIEDNFVVGPASEADDPGVPYCPTGYGAGGIRVAGATMLTVAEMLSLPPARAVAGHNYAGSHRPDRPLHDGAGLSVCPAGSGRSCCAIGVCGPFLVHRCSRAMGITVGAEQGAAESRRGRERTAADCRLAGGCRGGWCGSWTGAEGRRRPTSFAASPQVPRGSRCSDGRAGRGEAAVGWMDVGVVAAQVTSPAFARASVAARGESGVRAATRPRGARCSSQLPGFVHQLCDWYSPASEPL
jgi:uncharacterized protein (TIGR03435 family)